MSGIEPIKIIVDTEKQAAEMLEKAQAKAIQIRKGLETRIRGEREDILRSAKKEADAILERAESDGKLEAGTYEKEAVPRIKEVVAKAAARKGRAVDRLVSIVLEGNV
jgi:vacuolar-type H+-ATPase subunit H